MACVIIACEACVINIRVFIMHGFPVLAVIDAAIMSVEVMTCQACEDEEMGKLQGTASSRTGSFV